jgi:HEAT repeat protein
MTRLGTALLALFGLAFLPGALALPRVAAQGDPERQTLPPDPKRVAEMLAFLKNGLDSGKPLHQVLAGAPGDYSPALVKLLDDPKVDRSHVLAALFNTRGQSAVVVPAIARLLQKEELSQHRRAAVEVLWKHEEWAVPVLLEVLKVAKEDDMLKNLGVRNRALWALGTLDVNQPGRNVNAIVQVLGPATKHKDADVRRAAVASLGRFQVRDQKGQMLPHPGMPQLLAALKDKDAKVRELAAKALGDARGLPAEDRKSVPGLLELALSDHVDEAKAMPRWVAIHSLALMGDAGVKPLLDAPWGRNDLRIRVALLQALATTTNKSKVVLRFLLDNLGDQYAIQALAQINYGEAAQEAVPSLTGSLKGGSGYQRHWALEALFAVGPRGPIAAASALKNADSPLREAILKKLNGAKSRSREIVPFLIPCLEDKSAQVRALSAEVLGEIGPDARAALKALDNALDDRDPTVRAAVQAALKRIKR